MVQLLWWVCCGPCMLVPLSHFVLFTLVLFYVRCCGLEHARPCMYMQVCIYVFEGVVIFTIMFMFVYMYVQGKRIYEYEAGKWMRRGEFRVKGKVGRIVWGK